MAKLQLKHKTYKIEITDEGDYIEIDPLDLQFPLAFQKAYEKIQKLQTEAIAAEKEISQTGDDEDGYVVTRKQAAVIEMMNEKYNEMRKILDDLFGDGFSFKVFGGRNWITMFNEFFEALTPLLEEAGVNAGSEIEAVKAKYGAADTDGEL